jgi:two-component system response regulator MtrA
MALILVCDNEEPLRALIRASLAGSGHEIVEARDGDESLDLAKHLQPDLIVLDVMMPGRSGLEVLRELRTDASLADTPVVMLTARAQPTDREAAVAAGADRFVAKPFSPMGLARLVDGLLAKGRR